MYRLVRCCVAFACFALLPTVAAAQATIAGVVKDASGAVLPGVTVEASSPALIEKVRSVVTDGSGQYRIVDLRPGTYAVTFTLGGFSTVKREGIELTGTFTATVNADLRVGALEETITVTGETSVVDVQTVTQQRVMSKDVVDAIPTGRYILNVAVLIPGMSLSAGFGGLTQDVGGNVGEQMQTLAIHGSKGGDNRITLDGLSIADAMGTGSTTGFVPNMTSAQEVTVDTSAVSADQAGGGVRINIIPREGGNRFSGTFYVTGQSDAFQATNLSQELIDQGLRVANGIKSSYDVNPGVGGPIVKDKLWFYGSLRRNGNDNWVGGMFVNQNAGNASAWTYAPDTSQQGFLTNRYSSQQLRVTYQATQKNKFSVFVDDQQRESHRVTSTASPEAAARFHEPVVRLGGATWSSPVTSRLLIEAGYQQTRQGWGNKPAESPIFELIGLTSQASGLTYRAPSGNYPYQPQGASNLRASVSYITGSHSVKVGFTDRWAYNTSQPSDNPYNLAYRVNNETAAVPNQITQRAIINYSRSSMPADWAIYAQDRWTLKKLTLSGAIRLEGLVTETTEGYAGPSLYAPNRNISFSAQPWGNQKDVTPRIGASYDLFGNGKTALKASINKYIAAGGLTGFNPLGNAGLSTSITRTFNDLDRDYVADCDLLNLQANGECGIASDLNFGSTLVQATVDPRTYTGWGTRSYNWEFSTSVQHELMPRFSVNAGYFRRWYGNFTVTDNVAVTAADFGQFQLTAPADSRLPDGGNYAVTGLFNVNPNKVGQTNNYTTFSSEYGKQIEHWNGIDLGADVRLRQGILLQGGISTGRTSTDNCEVREQLPEIQGTTILPLAFCHVDTKFLTQAKMLAAYTVPRVDVQVAATFQSIPGPEIAANFVATNAMVAPSLGRNLSAGATANVTVNIVEPGNLFGDRLNQLDLRFSKNLRFAGTKLALNLDIFNAFNANPVTGLNNNYATWQVPQNILDARLFKIGAQFDF